MAKRKEDKIIQQSEARAQLISDLFDQFEQLIDRFGLQLSEDIINQMFDKLTTEDGVVLTTAENMRKVAIIDRVWENFQNQQGMQIVSNLITGLDSITKENLKYYRTLSSANINGDDIKNIINERLGLVVKADGTVEPKKGGYMKGLMDDPTIRNEIKNFTYQKITQGAGFTDLSKGLKNMIVGNEEKLGAFSSFYRNYAFDTYAKIDRLNGALYAEKLKLKYFIYQGTKRKGSRYFCLKRKGQVFTTEEAEEWKKLIGKTLEVPGERKKFIKVQAGPIVEDPASYNPVIDMGGIGCVDIASFISEEVAFYMRPDLRNKAMKVNEDYKQEHEGTAGAKVYVNKNADKTDLDYNISKAKVLANNGISVKIRPHVQNSRFKNPELEFADGSIGDFKKPVPEKSIKTSIQTNIKRAQKQGASTVVFDVERRYYDKNEIIRALNGSLSKGKNKEIEKVYIMLKNQVIDISRNDIRSKSYYDKLP